jgi:flagellar export protein FliJ
MKRFDFKLEQVRGWTDTRRRVEESKLETLFAALRTLDEDFARTSAQCVEYGREVYRMEQIDSASLVTLNEFRQFVTRERSRVERVRRDLASQIEAQQKVLVEIKRKLALFDRLKGAQRAVWQAEADRELQAIADESVAARFIREHKRR